MSYRLPTRALLIVPLMFGCSAAAPPRLLAASVAQLSGSRDYDAVAYALAADFDDTTRRLTAHEQITLALPDPTHAVVELDAAVQVQAVHVGQQLLPYSVNAARMTLAVDLSSVAAKQVTFTVDYVATPSLGMVVGGPRDGDPIGSRVVATRSEPDRGRYWLVADHRPFDRALWSIALTVDGGDDVIANGERLSDRTTNGRRTVSYALDLPIPTYLMAFAAGELVHEDRDGAVPLSIWHRKGFIVDSPRLLDILAGAMARYGSLMGAYPWPRYSLVFLPQYDNAMENATISFSDEEYSQVPADDALVVHELAHHWWGDWVTIHDFDDLWIKEGMAVLLQAEADRPRRDAAGFGRLFGIEYYFLPTDAVVDTTLSGIDKYTTGPYERAAWMITQIRATVGETSFWRSIRDLLASHALGDVTTEQFVQGFAPALDARQIAQVLATLPLKPAPTINVETAPQAEGTALTLTLSDPSSAILAPPRMTVVDAAGKPTTTLLEPGAPLTLLVPTGGYVAPDEGDVHPEWWYSFGVDPAVFFSQLGPLLVPTSSAALATLAARSASHQERAGIDGGFAAPSTSFSGFYAGLDSTYARYYQELAGCFALMEGGDSGWTATLAPILAHPPGRPYVDLYDSSYGSCGKGLAEQDFDTAFPALAHAIVGATEAPFSYVASYDYGLEQTLATLTKAAATVASQPMREVAIQRLADQATGAAFYTPVDAARAPAWRSFFEARLAEATSQPYFMMVWAAIVALSDDAALPIAGHELHVVPFDDATAVQVVCQAHELAQGGDWALFQAAAQPWSSLPADVQALLATPAGCASTSAITADRLTPVRARLVERRHQRMHDALSPRP